MEIVFYSDRKIWLRDDPNPIVRGFLASPLPICLCTQLSDSDTNSATGFFAQHVGPTRIVKSLTLVTIAAELDWSTPQTDLQTIVTNAVQVQGTSMQAALNLFRFASGGSDYPYQVFCFYGPIDLTGCTSPFPPPRRTLLLKTPTSPIQVMIANTHDAPKILTTALATFTDQVDSTLLQIANGQGYLVSIGLVNYINVDDALAGIVHTYPLDVWSQVLIQYMTNPFPIHTPFPLTTVLVIVLAVVVVVLQLRTRVRM